MTYHSMTVFKILNGKASWWREAHKQPKNDLKNPVNRKKKSRKGSKWLLVTYHYVLLQENTYGYSYWIIEGAGGKGGVGIAGGDLQGDIIRSRRWDIKG